MTQEDIIEMARQAAAQITIQANGDVFYSFYGIELEAFAKLVAAHVSRELAKEFAGMGEWDAVHIIEGVRW